MTMGAGWARSAAVAHAAPYSYSQAQSADTGVHRLAAAIWLMQVQTDPLHDW